MTHKDSICVSCANLSTYTDVAVVSGGDVSLISSCHYGGKNAGDRRSCKHFRQACPETVAERKEVFNRFVRI